MIYAIMERKTEKAYIKVFETLKTLLEATEVNLCMADYETALRKAVQKVFPEISVKGCFFHYKKAVLRRIRKLGLENADTPDEIICGLKYASNLALLPQRFINTGILLAESKIGNSPNSTKLSQYLRNQWADKEISVFKDKVRTNNGSEAMHRRIISLLGQPHPSIFIFLEFLQKLEQHVSLELRRDQRNNPSSNYRKKEYIAADERIAKAEKIFEKNKDVEMFLSNVSGIESGIFIFSLIKYFIYILNFKSIIKAQCT